MNLEHLRYFETIAKLEHYGKAASLLHVTQPNLSHAMAQLEIKLFEKSGRNVRLTRYGAVFLEAVSGSLGQLDRTVRNLKEIQNGSGLIILGCTRDLGSGLVPFLMRDFKRTARGKNVAFQLHTDSSFSGVLLNQALEGRYDMVFTSLPGDPLCMESFAFAQPPFIAAVSQDHPLAGRDEISLHETLAYPHIFLSKKSGLRAFTDHLFYQIGAFPSVSYETEEDFVAAGLASAGFGIAILPDHPFLHTTDLRLLTITAPDPKRTAYLSLAKEIKRSKAAEYFYEFCQERLAFPKTNRYGHSDARK